MPDARSIATIDDTILIVVHPGSFFSSARNMVDDRLWNARHYDLMREIMQARNLIVIDGFLSDTIPASDAEDIQSALERCKAGGGLALRAWGCDAGEKPYPGWKPFGTDPVTIARSQEEAARFFSWRIGDRPVELTGAWATHDGESGCVNSVADALRAARPGITTRILESAIFEEDIEEDFEKTPEP